MSNDKILYYLRDEQCIFKFIGEVRHSICSGFNAILDEAFNNKKLTSYAIDLRDANYLDSTSLGLIAKIARHTHLNSLPRPSIFSTNENINEILISMGFDGIFLICKNDLDNSEQFHDIGQETDDFESNKRMILEAHQILMDINEANRAKFEDVVKYLNSDKK